NVVVETKRKRVVVPKPGAPKVVGGPGGSTIDMSRRPAGISDAELERRIAALQIAKAREADETAQRAAEERERAEDRERRRAEIEAKEREEREHAEAMKAKAEEEARLAREAAEAARRSELRAAEAAAPGVQAEEPRADRGAKPSMPGARKPDREAEERRNAENKGSKARGDDAGR